MLKGGKIIINKNETKDLKTVPKKQPKDLSY
jgi:hypothetical protein